jgi:hypothetical protein
MSVLNQLLPIRNNLKVRTRDDLQEIDIDTPDIQH